MRAILFMLLTGCGLSNKQPYVADDDTGSGFSAPDNSIVLGMLSIAPTSINFGNVLLGESDSQLVSLVNNGEDDISIVSIAIEGDSEFALQSTFNPFDLAGGEDAVVTVDFNPITEADYSATLGVLISSESSKAEINVSGSGTINPDDTTETGTDTDTQTDTGLSLAQSSHDFGDVAMGQIMNQSISITNNSSTDITIQDILSSDPAFSLSDSSNVKPGEVIEAGITQAITVRFAPTEEIPYSGTITINSDSAETPSLDLALTGTGNCATCAPAIYVLSDNLYASVGSSIKFDNVFGTASIPISITNNGDEPLIVSSVDIVDNGQVGSFAACGDLVEFSISGTSTGTIDPGNTSGLTFDLTATVVGSSSDLPLCGISDMMNSITINSNDPVNPAYTLQIGGSAFPI